MKRLRILSATIAIDICSLLLFAANANDATSGYISIKNGAITITSSADAIQATTDVAITGQNYTNIRRRQRHP